MYIDVYGDQSKFNFASWDFFKTFYVSFSIVY